TTGPTVMLPRLARLPPPVLVTVTVCADADAPAWVAKPMLRAESVRRGGGCTGATVAVTVTVRELPDAVPAKPGVETPGASAAVVAFRVITPPARLRESEPVAPGP